MCGICGCSEESHDAMHHSHEQQTTVAAHHHETLELINIEQDILSKNNVFAVHNQKLFSQKKIFAVNIMSSPGSGKTTLLAKTISEMTTETELAVIVGDQESDYDAAHIRSIGGTAVQVNTGRVCHLDAHMIGHAIEQLPIKESMILFIENIGNLVCPSLFHLGEKTKVVLLSVTEGENKPLKYPDIFHSADLMIVTKMDLLPHVEFNVEQCIEYARRIKPNLDVITLSAKSGQGMRDWYDWLSLNQR